MKKDPGHNSTDSAEIEALITSLERGQLRDEDTQLLARLLQLLLRLITLLQRKNASLARLKQLLFGPWSDTRREMSASLATGAEGGADSAVQAQEENRKAEEELTGIGPHNGGNMKCLALCPLALVVLTSFISAQDLDPWKKYQPRTLDQIIKNYAAKVLDDPDILMNFPNGSTAVLARDSFTSKVKVTYTGQSRSISPKRKEIISNWLTVTYPDRRDEYFKLLDTEFLFTETLIEYWLPVQNPLIQPLQEELKKGDGVTLYVSWIGARKESGKVDWIFLVNEFEKE
jgi:hypothetical protein